MDDNKPFEVGENVYLDTGRVLYPRTIAKITKSGRVKVEGYTAQYRADGWACGASKFDMVQLIHKTPASNKRYSAQLRRARKDNLLSRINGLRADRLTDEGLDLIEKALNDMESKSGENK